VKATLLAILTWALSCAAADHALGGTNSPLDEQWLERIGEQWGQFRATMCRLMIPAIGLMCAVMGIIFLVGCSDRVDSPGCIERACGYEQKVIKLRSLQASWDRLGKLRQFTATSTGWLIMAGGLLLVWQGRLRSVDESITGLVGCCFLGTRR
jgi:hypothetical protein